MSNIIEISKLVIPSGMEGIVICLPDEDRFEFVTAAEIFPGSLVQICFGEMGFGGIPKRRYSYQWVAVLDAASNLYRGITLERGWMTGPPANTVFRFTNNQVCKVGNPEDVGTELRQTWIWQEQEIAEHMPVAQSSSTDA